MASPRDNITVQASHFNSFPLSFFLKQEFLQNVRQKARVQAAILL